MSDHSRRKFLAAAGGVACLAGVGYVGAWGLARKGEIIVRMVQGEEYDGSTLVGVTDLFWEEVNLDGSQPDRRFHPDYRQYFPEEPPMTVSPSAHRELQQEFDRVVYALAQTCPNADCSGPQVNLHDFNSVRVGEEVRLLYHPPSSATIIP